MQHLFQSGLSTRSHAKTYKNCSVRRQLLVEARVEVEENVHGPEDQVQDGVELQKQVLHSDRYNSPYPVPFAQNLLQAFYL